MVVIKISLLFAHSPTVQPLLNLCFKLDIYKHHSRPFTKCNMIIFTKKSIYIVQNIAYMIIHTPNPLSLAKTNRKSSHIFFNSPTISCVFFTGVKHRSVFVFFFLSFSDRQLPSHSPLVSQIILIKNVLSLTCSSEVYLLI